MFKKKQYVKWQIDITDHGCGDFMYVAKRLDYVNGVIGPNIHFYKSIRFFKTLEEAKKFVDDHFDFPIEIVRKMSNEQAY